MSTMDNSMKRVKPLIIILIAVAAHAMAEEAPRFLLLLADGFNRGEYFQSYLPLLALGYEVDIAGVETGTVFCSTARKPDREGRDAEANLGYRRERRQVHRAGDSRRIQSRQSGETPGKSGNLPQLRG